MLFASVLIKCLVMCGDSDTSTGFTKESSSDIGVRAFPPDSSGQLQNYHNQLLSTMKILQNKDETLRVQCESLHFAETRIADLTVRNNQLRLQLDEKTQELLRVRRHLDDNLASVESQTIPEVVLQGELVKSLQEHIAIIEELYRESFFETARQEQLIDTLRKSNLDIRLMEKEKMCQIVMQHGGVVLQHTSLDRCREIAEEVENLKSEIWNFLNNSNNDSGVWDQSEESMGDFSDELQDIMQQLMQLRDLLIDNCSCEDASGLRDKNDCLQAQVRDLNRKVEKLDDIVAQKDDQIKQLSAEIQQKDKQVGCVCEDTLSVQETNEMLQEQVQDLKRNLENVENVVLQKDVEIKRITAQMRTKSDSERCSFADNCSVLKEHNEHLQTQIQDLNMKIEKLNEIISQRDNTTKEIQHKFNNNIIALNQTNQTLQAENEDLNMKIEKLEDTLLQRDKQTKLSNSELHQTREELSNAQKHITELEDGIKSSQRLILQQRHITDTLQQQLIEKQGTLTEKTSELETAKCICRSREEIIEQLKEKLRIIEQQKYSDVNAEVSILRSQLIDATEREREKTNRLDTLQHHYKQLQESYKQKESTAAYLERELHASTERGAELCAESRRVLAILRSWISNVRATHRKQTHKIREKDRVIRLLRQKLGYDDTSETDAEENCKHCRVRKRRSDDAKDREEPCCSRASTSGVRQNITLCDRVKERKHSVPVGRSHRRKHGVPKVDSKCLWGLEGRSIETSPEPPIFCLDDYIAMDDITPTAELQTRVIRLQDALAEGQRRWTKHCHR